MAILTWNVAASKYFHSGIDKPVLYVRDASGAYPLGVPWEGLISVTDKPAGAEPTKLWANNVQYAQLVSAETFGGTIEAYQYPDEFMACMGVVEEAAGFSLAQQARSYFGLVYRTWVGNDAGGPQDDYLLHLIYGCLAQPAEAAHNTYNESPEAETMSWEFGTTPVSATGYSPVSKITIDSRTILGADLTTIENQLFGTAVITANLPLPDALIAMLTP